MKQSDEWADQMEGSEYDLLPMTDVPEELDFDHAWRDYAARVLRENDDRCLGCNRMLPTRAGLCRTCRLDTPGWA